MFNAIAGGIFSFGFVLFLFRLHYDTTIQGYMMFMMEVTIALTILPFGISAPKVGKRLMMMLGLGMTAMAYLTISFSSEIWHFIMAMVLWGLGSSMISPTLSASLADSVCDRDRKYLMNINAFFTMIASATGFFISGLIVHFMGEVDGYRQLFRVAAATVLVAAFFLTRRIDCTCGPPAEIRKGARKILPFVLPQLVLGFGAGLVIPFFPVYFKLRFSTPDTLISTIFTVTQVFWAVSYMAMPFFAEKAGSVKALLVLQTMAVVALFAIPMTPSFESTAVLYAVRMILMNASRPLADSYMMTLLGKDLRSTAVAANQMAWMIPHMISVAIGGFIMSRVSLELPFFICGVMYVISTSLYAYFFMGRDDLQKAHE